MAEPEHAEVSLTGDEGFVVVLVGERGRNLARHFQALTVEDRMNTLGQFLAFVSEFMQEKFTF